MDIQKDWKEIRSHFNKSFRSNFHVSIASVGPDQVPTVTPIGSLFLNQNQTGFYFEKFPSRLPLHAEIHPGICALAVYSNSWFWLTALFRGRFHRPPAIRLYGVLEKKRKATPLEISRLNRRMKGLLRLKGGNYLWGEMEFVRDITFTRAEKVNLGEMTRRLS
jgi:hypothetical protein